MMDTVEVSGTVTVEVSENGIGQTEMADKSLIGKKEIIGGKDVVNDKEKEVEEESVTVSAEKMEVSEVVEESGNGIRQNVDTISTEKKDEGENGVKEMEDDNKKKECVEQNDEKEENREEKEEGQKQVVKADEESDMKEIDKGKEEVETQDVKAEEENVGTGDKSKGGQEKTAEVLKVDEETDKEEKVEQEEQEQVVKPEEGNDAAKDNSKEEHDKTAEVVKSDGKAHIKEEKGKEAEQVEAAKTTKVEGENDGMEEKSEKEEQGEATEVDKSEKEEPGESTEVEKSEKEEQGAATEVEKSEKEEQGAATEVEKSEKEEQGETTKVEKSEKDEQREATKVEQSEKEEQGEATEVVAPGKKNATLEEKGSEKAVERAEVSNCEEENPKVAEEDKQPKKRVREKRSGGKAEAEKLEVGGKKSKEPVTPVAFSTDRPVRERKSVERLVAAVVPEPIRKFRIEKGRGTSLKDIPNVANQLNKQKGDETFKLLHLVLFGRHMKAFKSNLSEFSGFTCHENEEKHRSKIKEKLDKYFVDNLLEFCDVLDIHVEKRTRTRKDELVAELLNFLAAPAPRVTTDVVPAEKELLSSTIKRKRDSVSMIPASSGSTTAKRSARKRRKIVGTVKDEEKKSSHGKEDGSEEDNENENGVPDASEDEVAEHFLSKDEDNDSNEAEEPTLSSVKSSRKSELKKTLTPKGSEHSKSKDEDNDPAEEMEEPKQGSAKSSVKKEASLISESKKTPTNKKVTTVSLPRKHSGRSTCKQSKVENSLMHTPVASSSKKKDVETAKRKRSAPSKSATIVTTSKEKPGNKLVDRKDERSKGLNPSEDELRCTIAQILDEVDFNTATFTDIVKKLASHYDMDFTPRKEELKRITKEELMKRGDEDEETEEEDEGESEKEDAAKPAAKKMKT